jgi:hypothetical protein
VHLASVHSAAVVQGVGRAAVVPASAILGHLASLKSAEVPAAAPAEASKKRFRLSRATRRFSWMRRRCSSVICMVCRLRLH